MLLSMRGFQRLYSSVPGTGGRDKARISYHVTCGEVAASSVSSAQDGLLGGVATSGRLGNGGFLPQEGGARAAAGALRARLRASSHPGGSPLTSGSRSGAEGWPGHTQDGGQPHPPPRPRVATGSA